MPKYVDADALHERMIRRWWYVGRQSDPVCIIEDFPAADVEPKREIVPWKVAGTFDDFHQCTKCGNMWPIFSTVEWAYCPVCGCRKFPDPLKGENDVG